MARVGMRRLLVGSIAIATFIFGLPAWAIPARNLGFESGTLTPGWVGLGYVLDTRPPNVVVPPSGKYFIVVTSGCFTHTVHQRMTLRGDRVLSGLAAFQSNDRIQDGQFNDHGSIAVTPPAGEPVTVYSKNVADVGGGLFDFSPFETWSYTVPVDGVYILTYTSTNATDCFFGSELFGDAITTKTTCDALLPGLSLRCKLTDGVNGAGLPGETIRFTWGGPFTGAITAVTGPDGVATAGSISDAQSALAAPGYTGEFYGSANGNGSTGTGAVA